MMYNHYGSQYGGGGAPYGGGYVQSSSPRPALNIMGRMDENAATALLQHLGKEDLQTILNDDAKLQDLVNDLQQVKSVQSDHDDLVAANKSLAEYNLSQQPRLQALKTEVATEYENVNRLKMDLGTTKSRLDEIANRTKLDTVHALMQTSAAEAEEESEMMSESFLEGNGDLESFISSYLPCRKNAHLRRIRSEKMGELLRSDATSGWPAPGGSSALPYPSGSVHVPYMPGAGSAPYPVGVAFGMPDPSLYRP